MANFGKLSKIMILWGKVSKTMANFSQADPAALTTRQCEGIEHAGMPTMRSTYFPLAPSTDGAHRQAMPDLPPARGPWPNVPQTHSAMAGKHIAPLTQFLPSKLYRILRNYIDS